MPMKEKYACPSHITQDTQDTPGHMVTLNSWSFIYSGSQGCLEDFTSSEGLWGGTYIHICDIKERLGTSFLATFFWVLNPSTLAGDSPADSICFGYTDNVHT